MSKAVAVTTSLLLLLASSAPGAQGQQWTHFTSKDEMTGEIQAFATSPRTAPTRQLAFPYADVRGWLGFGCDGQDEWAYIGFTEAPNLTNTEPQSGGYSTFTARVRWDNDLQTMRMSQGWGERFLHFQSDATAVAKIAAAQTVLIELKWYGSGDVYFRFSLNGSADAIARAREACRK
ncbi:MAG: hypothetical protein AMS25_09100 [Gemmatimonas sp. SM23_52]|nr:MAG: hypothetical protein AMS25_09100 [Gemmatimonas sp. SM23_52]